MSHRTLCGLSRPLLTSLCVVGFFTAARGAQAQPGPGSEIAFTLSYADLAAELDADAFGFGLGDIDDFTGLDDATGIAGEIRFTRPFFVKQLRIGSAIGVSLYEEDAEDNDLFELEGDEELLLITPELQLSWRQPIFRRWFVEGGAGVGVVIANYQADGIEADLGDLDDIDEWAIGLGVRPFVRAGYAFDRLLLGVEASYRWTNLEFDDGDLDVEGDLDQFMIGGFVGVRF
jgi:hypothetical protein